MSWREALVQDSGTTAELTGRLACRVGYTLARTGPMIPKKAAIAGVLAAFLTTASAQDRALISGLDLSTFDRTVCPQDDLFRFVKGSWLARTPIPTDRVTYGTFLELVDKTDAGQADQDLVAPMPASLAQVREYSDRHYAKPVIQGFTTISLKDVTLG
jgi:hypothetical protein